MSNCPVFAVIVVAWAQEMVEDLEKEWKVNEKATVLQGWGFSNEEFQTLKVRPFACSIAQTYRLSHPIFPLG